MLEDPSNARCFGTSPDHVHGHEKLISTRDLLILSASLHDLDRNRTQGGLLTSYWSRLCGSETSRSGLEQCCGKRSETSRYRVSDHEKLSTRDLLLLSLSCYDIDRNRTQEGLLASYWSRLWVSVEIHALRARSMCALLCQVGRLERGGGAGRARYGTGSCAYGGIMARLQSIPFAAGLARGRLSAAPESAEAISRPVPRQQQRLFFGLILTI